MSTGNTRIAADDGSYPCPVDDTDRLRAHIQTLQGRLEALERAVTAMREREIKVRRAVGQLGAAFDLTK